MELDQQCRQWRFWYGPSRLSHCQVLWVYLKNENCKKNINTHFSQKRRPIRQMYKNKATKTETWSSNVMILYTSGLNCDNCGMFGKVKRIAAKMQEIIQIPMQRHCMNLKMIKIKIFSAKLPNFNDSSIVEWEKHGMRTIHSQCQQMEANCQDWDDAKLGDGAENFGLNHIKFWDGIDEGSQQIAEDCADCLWILIIFF